MTGRLLVVLALLVPLGVGTKFYAGPAAAWVRADLGGLLYVVFWCLVLVLLRPRLSPWRAGGAVLGITVALEVLQLWHPPLLERVRSTFLGHALIGSTFAWWDLPHYAAGVLIGVGVARALGHPHWRNAPVSTISRPMPEEPGT